MSRIDAEVASKIRQVIELARLRGVDPVHALDLAGMLRYPDKIFDDQVEFLGHLIEFTRKPPGELVSGERMPKSPLDLKNLVIKYLEAVKENFIREYTKKL
jgi:hypothetical protein